MGSSCRRCWSNTTTRSCGARTISPASGASSSLISRISVDLPLPLGPRSPSFVPGARVKLISRNSPRSPSVLPTFLSSMSFRVCLPEALKSIWRRWLARYVDGDRRARCSCRWHVQSFLLLWSCAPWRRAAAIRFPAAPRWQGLFPGRPGRQEIPRASPKTHCKDRYDSKTRRDTRAPVRSRDWRWIREIADRG